jgi:hypothetical protein
MLLFDGELLDAAEETGTVEKRSNVFFGRGFLGLGCPCNWAVFRLGEACMVRIPLPAVDGNVRGKRFDCCSRVRETAKKKM